MFDAQPDETTGDDLAKVQVPVAEDLGHVVWVGAKGITRRSVEAEEGWQGDVPVVYLGFHKLGVSEHAADDSGSDYGREFTASADEAVEEVARRDFGKVIIPAPLVLADLISVRGELGSGGRRRGERVREAGEVEIAARKR
jgi:hypothetical protein